MTTAIPRTTLLGFGAVGLFLGGAIGYLLGSTAYSVAGALIGALVGGGLVYLAYVPRPQDAQTHAAEPDHDPPKYMTIFFALFALTMVEVFFAFLALPRQYIILGLVLLALWKALLVALYYMHLKFEPRRLWLVAASPLPLAVILVLTVLAEGW